VLPGGGAEHHVVTGLELVPSDLARVREHRAGEDAPAQAERRPGRVGRAGRRGDARRILGAVECDRKLVLLPALERRGRLARGAVVTRGIVDLGLVPKRPLLLGDHPDAHLLPAGERLELGAPRGVDVPEEERVRALPDRSGLRDVGPCLEREDALQHVGLEMALPRVRDEAERVERPPVGEHVEPGVALADDAGKRNGGVVRQRGSSYATARNQTRPACRSFPSQPTPAVTADYRRRRRRTPRRWSGSPCESCRSWL
jgi:hypothetical protein